MPTPYLQRIHLTVGECITLELFCQYIFLYKEKEGVFTVPDTVREIAESAFRKQRVSEVILPEGLEKIGNDAFYGCSALEKAVIGSGIKTALDSTNEAFAETENVTGLLMM